MAEIRQSTYDPVISPARVLVTRPVTYASSRTHLLSRMNNQHHTRRQPDRRDGFFDHTTTT